VAAAPAFHAHFRSSCTIWSIAPTFAARVPSDHEAMILQRWLEELRGAMSEQDVVSFARGKLERAPEQALPGAIAHHALRSANDVREVAASLAALPASASQDSDLVQQLLIVFSLAADRLADLERRGMVVRARRGATSAG